MNLLTLDVFLIKVTCPGVWLCPKGDVFLKVNCFTLKRKTKRVYPKFPLMYAEELSFQKVSSGSEILAAHDLDKEFLGIELIQRVSSSSGIGVILAKFNQSLNEIFSLAIADRNLSVTRNVDLLMRRTDYFPGIIAPKISVFLKLTMEKVMNYEICNSMFKRKTPLICSKELNVVDQLIHQRPVCHFHRRCHTDRESTNSSCCSGLLDSNDDYQIRSNIANSNYTCGYGLSCDGAIHPYCDKDDFYCTWCSLSCPCKCYTCCKYHQVFH